MAAGVNARELAVYVPSQVVGAIAGAILADAMFGEPLVKWSTHDRSAGNLLLGEVVATAGLILLIFGLARTDRLRFAPVAVASYIGAAYWFTSSTSFANPAVTIGRAFTDTFMRHRPGLGARLHRHATDRRRGGPRPGGGHLHARQDGLGDARGMTQRTDVVAIGVGQAGLAAVSAVKLARHD